MRTLVLAVVIFIAGITLGGCNADDAAPATRTVTETVEVAGPTVTVYTLSTECRDFLSQADDTVDQIFAYEGAVSPTQQNLRDIVRAAVTGDVQLANQTITTANEIDNATTGPLQIIVANRSELPAMRDACRATLED